MFNGLDLDGACSMLLLVCLATSGKVISFHSMCIFVQGLVRNLFCSGRVNDILYALRQRCAMEFYAKFGKSGEETLEMLQNAYGTEAVS
jgi:hypothetical protein